MDMSDFSVTVREASDADMASVRTVMSAATKQLRTVSRPTAEAVAKAKAAPVKWLVAMSGARAVGALRYWAEGDAMHLGLGVLPECQRQGVGRAMVEQLAAKAAAAGLKKLALYTVVTTGNVAIFERWGFRVNHVEPAQGLESSDGRPLTEAYMEWGVTSK